MTVLYAIDTVSATFGLALLVLVSAVGLSVFAAYNKHASKQIFAVVGVLLGLFGAGGLGSLFASQAANEAAEQAAPEAAAAAVEKVAQKEERSESSKDKGESEGSKEGNGGTK